jgi:hypothetical protein
MLKVIKKKDYASTLVALNSLIGTTVHPTVDNKENRKCSTNLSAMEKFLKLNSTDVLKIILMFLAFFVEYYSYCRNKRKRFNFKLL